MLQFILTLKLRTTCTFLKCLGRFAIFDLWVKITTLLILFYSERSEMQIHPNNMNKYKVYPGLNFNEFQLASGPWVTGQFKQFVTWNSAKICPNKNVNQALHPAFTHRGEADRNVFFSARFRVLFTPGTGVSRQYSIFNFFIISLDNFFDVSVLFKTN